MMLNVLFKKLTNTGKINLRITKVHLWQKGKSVPSLLFAIVLRKNQERRHSRRKLLLDDFFCYPLFFIKKLEQKN